MNETVLSNEREEILEQAKARFGQLSKVFEKTSDELLSKYSTDPFRGLELEEIYYAQLRPFLLPEVETEWQPSLVGEFKDLFPRPDNGRLYHITSTQALKSMKKEMPIIPLMFHHEYKISTHRGLGLQTLSRFLEGVGIGLGDKDMHIWCSPSGYVDPELFLIEEHIAQNPDLDRDLLDLLFSTAPLLNKEYGVLSPKLKNILNKVSTKDSTRTAEEVNFIDEFLKGLFKNFGVRDGWFSSLEALLKGNEECTSSINVDILETHLLNGIEYFGRDRIPTEEQAILLELDFDTLSDMLPLSVRPWGSRPLETIVSVPGVPIDSIRSTYLRNPDAIDFSTHLPVKGLHALEDQNNPFMLSKKPTQLLYTDIKPSEPMCRLNYTDPKKRYATLFEEQKLGWLGGLTGSLRRDTLLLNQLCASFGTSFVFGLQEETLTGLGISMKDIADFLSPNHSR